MRVVCQAAGNPSPPVGEGRRDRVGVIHLSGISAIFGSGPISEVQYLTKIFPFLLHETSGRTDADSLDWRRPFAKSWMWAIIVAFPQSTRGFIKPKAGKSYSNCRAEMSVKFRIAQGRLN